MAVGYPGADRIRTLPVYIAQQLTARVADARARGVDVISLGVGDPDRPPPGEARAFLAATVQRTDVAHYPTNRGLPELRRAVASFYASRFGVELDPEREVLPLLGAKEGIAHLALASLDPGDVALVADPGYPVYASGAVLAGAEPVPLPLLPERGFQPDLDAIPAGVARRARLLTLGYPNNPTGAVAEDGLFARLVAFADRHDVPICHDNAYSEITWDGHVAPSFLETEGAREVGVEILSLSKAFSAPGWRIAFCVGNARIIEAYTRLRTHVDAGMFVGLQHAAIHLLGRDPAERRELAGMYARRARIVCDALAAAGSPVIRPRGGMYVWLPVPEGPVEGSSLRFADLLLERAAVVVLPGVAYGAGGEGYVRLALTVPDERLAEAMARLVAVL
jgi:LL-diaminopimelate aminotransferase